MAIQKIPNTLIADNAVTAAKIANGSLTADDISNNSITAAKLSVSTSPTFADLTLSGSLNNMTISASGFTCPTSQNFVINSPNGFRVNIDSNNDGTQENFVVGNNQTDAAANNILFKVNEAGKASIGHGAANANLHIGDAAATGNATNPALQIGGASTYRLGIYTGTEDAIIENKNGDDGIAFRVKTAGEAMRIDGGTGNVGIGNSAPSRNLTVGDTASSSAINIKSSATNGYSILAFGDSGDDNYAQIFLDNSTNKVQIQNGGGGAIGNRGITLDSSENVGIGTDSPSRALEVNTDGTAQFRLTRTDSTINGNNTIGTIEFVGTDDTSGTIGATIVAAAGSTWGGGAYPTDLRFSTMTGSTLSERMRILSDGGITFNGDTAAANALDDYEEGTFSPTLSNAYNITSLTLSEAGRYVKIGNLVHFEFQVTGSFTNAAVESRFSFTVPFTIATSSSRATGMFSHHLTSFSNGRFNNGQIFQGTTTNTATWVYISTNQLSGIGSFTGRGTFTYVAA